MRLIAALALLPLAADAEAPTPKLGPNAVAVTEDTAYLRSAAAPDFWAFSPFVKPQFTSSACSVAAVTASLNGLAGLPAAAEETVMTQPALLDLVAREDWTRLSAEGGDGVRFDQLAEFTKAALTAREMKADVETFHPAEAGEATLAQLRGLLARNEEAADTALLVYFNQGVVTGDWDGPHVALVGAFDAATDRVLVLEVDQEWYVPYWTPVPVLLEAMLKPTSQEHGVLEGETGGLVLIALRG